MLRVVALLASLCSAGCSTMTTVGYSEISPKKGMASQNPQLVKRADNEGSGANAPVLIRIFKQEKQLELWRQDASRKYVLIHTFDICHYSGGLGPKRVQGDRQAPEGFYTITQSQLNYNSVAYLSLDTGYPNVRDRANGGTGSALMIHGGCSSAGCFAIEDRPMQDLFATVRDSLRAGQREVQLHIFPFRMTSWNMAAHVNNPNYAFWLQLKRGYDLFTWDRRDLDIVVANGRYVAR